MTLIELAREDPPPLRGRDESEKEETTKVLTVCRFSWPTLHLAHFPFTLHFDENIPFLLINSHQNSH